MPNDDEVVVKVLVTGGCGYTGSVLLPRLVQDGHEVVVIDAMWFGNHLEPGLEVDVIDSTVGDIKLSWLRGVDAVIHLANVANDPSVDLDPTLSWDVNVLATQHLGNLAVRAGVRQIIFASSGSVYGVKREERVTEDLDLVPISTYNKTKMIAERILLSYSDHIRIHNIRPATVCGLSPRMRLDVTVNMFVKQAIVDGVITVFGGSQIRPNIHIEDLIAVYRHFLANPELPNGPYNAGFENLSVAAIAQVVANETGCDVDVTDSNDPRSYRLDSSKLRESGFRPTHTVKDAIYEIREAFNSGDLQDSDWCYTVRWMRSQIERGELKT